MTVHLTAHLWDVGGNQEPTENLHRHGKNLETPHSGPGNRLFFLINILIK